MYAQIVNLKQESFFAFATRIEVDNGRVLY